MHNRDSTDNDILTAATRGGNGQSKPTRETEFI